MDSKPTARKAGIVVQSLAGELLIYDLERHRAFCLNETAALIWKRCDGRTDIARLTEILQEGLEGPMAEEALWLGLEQLSKSNLLEKSQKRPAEKPKVSRRDMIKRIGATAAIMLPLVISISAPRAAHAGTCIPPGGGQPCTNYTNCCSGRGNCTSGNPSTRVCR